MTERPGTTPGDRRPAIAGSIPPPGFPEREGPARSDADPVELEWDRLERGRVAAEVAEAREDVIEAIAHPVAVRGRRSRVWWAFALALLAGVVFAVAINAFLSPTPPSADGGAGVIERQSGDRPSARAD